MKPELVFICYGLHVVFLLIAEVGANPVPFGNSYAFVIATGRIPYADFKSEDYTYTT